MSREKQIKKQIKILKELRDNALKTSEEAEYLFVRNLAKQAYNGFVEAIKEHKEHLINL